MWVCVWGVGVGGVWVCEGDGKALPLPVISLQPRLISKETEKCHFTICLEEDPECL